MIEMRLEFTMKERHTPSITGCYRNHETSNWLYLRG